DEIFFGIPEEQTVWMSHSDKVIEIPEGFESIADSPSTPYAAIEDKERRIYGVQFHPEVRHTEYGNDILRNFVRRVCDCTGEWTMENFIEVEIEKIREKVGDRKVLCAMSGGVDSSVVAVLLHKAIGDQLTCIFVD
ncbi:GMP synthase (glutamine-hydrolyzing), partial [Staphylococcus nepalensis]